MKNIRKFSFFGFHFFDGNIFSAGLGGSFGSASDWKPGGRGFDPC